MTSILSVLAIPPAPIQLLVAAAILIGEPALLAGFVLPSATAALSSADGRHIAGQPHHNPRPVPA